MEINLSLLFSPNFLLHPNNGEIVILIYR